MTKASTIRRPGKSSPATPRSVIQGPLQQSITKRMPTETMKPFAELAITAHLQRVSIADSFGASPASSALDVSDRRDPGGNCTNLTRQQKIESSLAKPTSAG
jgi:hypothetical protein